MKVTVKVDERYFEVEIENLYTRPVIATVEGETFEVWPAGGFAAHPVETSPTATATAAAARQVDAAPATPPPANPAAGAPAAAAAQRDVKAIHAPIPGVIVSIEVAVGDMVEVGQTLCVLEAMKMKNAIRAPRAGEIAAILVAAGDHVKHHDLLMEYAGC